MQILQFPDSSWGLTVLKNIFLRFIGLKGLKMFWEKKVPDLNFFPWFWLKIPCFSLISLTRKSLQNFPWFPWSVGTLRYLMHNHFSTKNHFIRPTKFHELNSAWFISSWKDSMNKYCVYMDSKIPNVVLYMYKYYIQQKYMHWKNILHIYCSKRNGRFNGYVTVKCVQHSIAYSLLELSVPVWVAITTHSLEMPYVITTPVIISIYKASWNTTHLLGEQNTAMLFPWLHRTWQTYSCCDLHSWTP